MSGHRSKQTLCKFGVPIQLLYICIYTRNLLGSIFKLEMACFTIVLFPLAIERDPDSNQEGVESPEQLEGLKFEFVEANYVIQKVSLQQRDSTEEQFTFDTRGSDQDGSGREDVFDTTTPPATDASMVLPLWGLATVAVAGLVFLTLLIICPMIVCLLNRRTKRGSFQLEQCEFYNLRYKLLSTSMCK